VARMATCTASVLPPRSVSRMEEGCWEVAVSAPWGHAAHRVNGLAHLLEHVIMKHAAIEAGCLACAAATATATSTYTALLPPSEENLRRFVSAIAELGSSDLPAELQERVGAIVREELGGLENEHATLGGDVEGAPLAHLARALGEGEEDSALQRVDMGIRKLLEMLASGDDGQVAGRLAPHLREAVVGRLFGARAHWHVAEFDSQVTNKSVHREQRGSRRRRPVVGPSGKKASVLEEQCAALHATLCRSLRESSPTESFLHKDLPSSQTSGSTALRGAFVTQLLHGGNRKAAGLALGHGLPLGRVVLGRREGARTMENPQIVVSTWIESPLSQIHSGMAHLRDLGVLWNLLTTVVPPGCGGPLGGPLGLAQGETHRHRADLTLKGGVTVSLAAWMRGDMHVTPFELEGAPSGFVCSMLVDTSHNLRSVLQQDDSVLEDVGKCARHAVAQHLREVMQDERIMRLVALVRLLARHGTVTGHDWGDSAEGAAAAMEEVLRSSGWVRPEQADEDVEAFLSAVKSAIATIGESELCVSGTMAEALALKDAMGLPPTAEGWMSGPSFGLALNERSAINVNGQIDAYVLALSTALAQVAEQVESSSCVMIR
jgi:hypothetical protein